MQHIVHCNCCNQRAPVGANNRDNYHHDKIISIILIIPSTSLQSAITSSVRLRLEHVESPCLKHHWPMGALHNKSERNKSGLIMSRAFISPDNGLLSRVPPAYGIVANQK